MVRKHLVDWDGIDHLQTSCHRHLCEQLHFPELNLNSLLPTDTYAVGETFSAALFPPVSFGSDLTCLVFNRVSARVWLGALAGAQCVR